MQSCTRTRESIRGMQLSARILKLWKLAKGREEARRIAGLRFTKAGVPLVLCCAALPSQDWSPAAAYLARPACRSGGLQLFADSWDLLKAQVWPVLMMFAAADSLTFLVHRLCHRTTNQG